MSETRENLAALSNTTRACIAGGNNPSVSDVIDYVTIASTGDASDFGNLTQARFYRSGCSGHTRGIFGAGRVSPAMVVTMDYITIASTGNATDFGDMATARALAHGSSDSHGGLQS